MGSASLPYPFMAHPGYPAPMAMMPPFVAPFYPPMLSFPPIPPPPSMASPSDVLGGPLSEMSTNPYSKNPEQDFLLGGESRVQQRVPVTTDKRSIEQLKESVPCQTSRIRTPENRTTHERPDLPGGNSGRPGINSNRSQGKHEGDAPLFTSVTDWPKPSEVPTRKKPGFSHPEISAAKIETPLRRVPTLYKSAPIPGISGSTARQLSPGPPSNAPKGPRALLRRQQTQREASGRLSENASSGSWSQSRRWVSQGTKERMAFQRMKINLQHIKLQNSPFVPQTPAALTALRL